VVYDERPLIVSLLEDFQQSRVDRQWATMRELLHPEARLESLAAVGSVLTADELVEAIRNAVAHGLYSVRKWRVEALGPRVALADGRVRYQFESGGITDEHRSWAATEHEGLIWRMRIFEERSGAVACATDHGLDLGL
jgi:hypothetical protein